MVQRLPEVGDVVRVVWDYAPDLADCPQLGDIGVVTHKDTEGYWWVQSFTGTKDGFKESNFYQYCEILEEK